MSDPSKTAGAPGSRGSEGKPAPSRALRLLVVDDHEVVRQGLAAMLDRRESFQVVAEAGSVAEALAAAERFAPDLVIMDVRLPDGSGFKVILEAAPEGMYSENVEEAVAAMSQVVEKYVRAYPTQYMWSMKRFKKRPEGEKKWY